jgi:hypothetical protein
MDSVMELALAHRGSCPLLLCFMRPEGGAVFVDTHERFSVTPSMQLEQDADARFGDDTYYVKVDNSPPERVQRRWENRSADNGGE